MTIFLDLIEILLNFFLSNFVFPLKTGLCEGLLFRLRPLFIVWEEEEIRKQNNIGTWFHHAYSKFSRLQKIKQRGNTF